MGKISGIFNWARQCPQLSSCWSIAAKEDIGVRVILPQGASPAVQYHENPDVAGFYECDIVPYPSVYEDYQINCYEVYDPNDDSAPENNINMLNFDEVQKICDWVKEQNDNNNFPDIGEKIVSVECNPFVPQIRGVNPQDNTVAYFITVRIRYVNRAQRKSIEYELTD